MISVHPRSQGEHHRRLYLDVIWWCWPWDPLVKKKLRNVETIHSITACFFPFDFCPKSWSETGLGFCNIFALTGSAFFILALFLQKSWKMFGILTLKGSIFRQWHDSVQQICVFRLITCFKTVLLLN